MINNILFCRLFEEFLANGNKNRRTRFRDLFKPEDIGVDERNPLKLDYKSIKAATDKIRFDLADVAKSRNESSRSRRSSRLAAYLESEMSFETYTPAPKATLTLPKTPKTPADKGAIITLPEKGECKEEPAGFNAPPMSKRNETMLEPIPGSPAPEVAAPLLEKIKAIAQPKQESPMKSRLLKSRENGLSTSLPNLSRQHAGAAGVYTDSSKGHTRSYTDGKEKKKLKRKPLRDRIKDFYDDIQPLYSPKEDNLYLPPILTT